MLAFIGMLVGYFGSIVFIFGTWWLGSSLLDRDIGLVIDQQFGFQNGFAYFQIGTIFSCILLGGIVGIRFARCWRYDTKESSFVHPLD